MTPWGGRRAQAGVLLALLAAVGVGFAMDSRESDRAQLRQDGVRTAAEQSVADQAGRVAAAAATVQRALGAGGTAAREAAAKDRSEPALASRLLVGPAFRPAAAGAGSEFPTAALAAPGLRAAASTATDTGAPTAAAVSLPTGTIVVVLWPLYERTAPLNTAQRRGDADGWLLALVPTSVFEAAVRAPLAPVEPRLRLLGPRESGTGSVDDVLKEAFTVAPGPLTVDRLVIFGGPAVLFVLGILIVGLAVRGQRGKEALAGELAAAEQQLTLLGDLGATAQSGLDVSLTLPAVLTQLQQGLGLSQLVVRSGGGEDAVEVLVVGERVTGGTGLSLPLYRALRTVGVLEVFSRHPVSSAQERTLRSAADIIAGFLHNSELFEREQLAVARLRNLDRLKDDFLGTVSHELRTPLTIIVGFLAMLKSRWTKMSEDERIAAFDTVSNHATALTALVNDLLDFVTDRRTVDQVQPVPMVLAEPVGDIVERFRPLFADHSLVVALDPTVVASTDTRAIERILTNLLSNAAKYSPAQSVIEVGVRSVGEGAALVVRDHGAGIAPEDQQLIFERFYRGSTDAARGTRGTGIGLTIVKTWLELVGARLEVRSAAGVGTEMTVVFPADVADPVQEAGQIVWREFSEPLRSVGR